MSLLRSLFGLGPSRLERLEAKVAALARDLDELTAEKPVPRDTRSQALASHRPLNARPL